MVKNQLAMQETWVWEDPLEKEIATHSSILAWRIPWTEAPGGLQFMRSQRVGHDWMTNSSLLWGRVDLTQSLERKNGCLPSPIFKRKFSSAGRGDRETWVLILAPPFRSHFISFSFLPSNVEKVIHLSGLTWGLWIMLKKCQVSAWFWT